VALAAIAIGAATVAIVIAAILLSPITPSIIEQPRQEYDAAVILGAAVWSGNKPSPVLRERVNRGYDLIKSGAVQFLVLTGSNAPHELPEAEVARRELLKLGVDPTRIVVETQTHSTLDQILYIRDHLMKEQGWSSFIIVSDQFHLKRALEICQFNGINAQGVSSESPLGPQNLWIYHLRESAALILYWMFGI
jgi:vancomycin permeability regulator SanA